MSANPDIPVIPESVLTLCDQISEAVETMLNPVTPQIIRKENYHRLEQFKADSPMAVQCGIVLTGGSGNRPERSPGVRHFGLKVLEEAIKLKWNDMSIQQKVRQLGML